MITVEAIAASKIRELMSRENPDGIPETAGLRLFVRGGGCSGFQYGLTLESKPNETDQVFEVSGLRVFVDPISIRYVDGAEIYYHHYDSILGGGIAIKNPNATSTCGCGQSFTTEPPQE